MRVSPPKSLRLDRNALLKDVMDRLSQKDPALATALADRSNPGRLMLEQAAWMVEHLSTQLDAYPMSVLQQLVHFMGGRLKSAHPAVGVVMVDPREAGVLHTPEDRPPHWRFFSSQTEDRDALEFSPGEKGAPVRPGRVLGITSWLSGELWRSGQPGGPGGLASGLAWRGTPRRSRALDLEQFEYVLTGTQAEDMEKALAKALDQLSNRASPLGWLTLIVERRTPTQVAVLARVNPAGAFRRSAPTGLAPGGDLVADWGRLDDENWAPTVRISDHPALPPHLRGTPPLAGPEDGTLLIPNVPPNFPVERLLERTSTALPDNLRTLLWATLVRANEALSAWEPRIRRGVRPGAAEDEPTWIAQALRSQAWGHLTDRAPRHIVHLSFTPSPASDAVLRVALVGEAGRTLRASTVQVRAIDPDEGVMDTNLRIREAWSLNLPAARGSAGMHTVVVLEVTVPARADQALVLVDGPLRGAFLNPLLVLNAPVVLDGREVRIERYLPEAVSLLHQDVVTPAVLSDLLREPIPASTARLLRNIPLAWFQVDEGDPIQDFDGVQVDATAGEMTLNAPDDGGHTRALQPGSLIRLAWYRRTDGAVGTLEPGAIRHVEQPPSTSPVLQAVTNPLSTWYGAARETEDACRDRILAPATGTPVLPSDWEREIRLALGTRGRGWVVRCWSHPERTLLSTVLWPAEAPVEDDEARWLRNALSRAGAEQILVVLGPTDRVLADEDLQYAREVVDRVLHEVRQRVSTIRGAVVTRFWPLTLSGSTPTDLPLPCFDTRDLSGELTDPIGRFASVPQASLILNGAVIRASEPGPGRRNG